MFCVKCGIEVRPNAQYCHSCGTIVNAPAELGRTYPPSAAPQPSTIRPVPPPSSEGRVTSGLTRGNFIFSALAGALLIAFFSGLLAYFTALPSASLHDEMNPAGIAFSAACGPAYGGAVFGLVIGGGLGWLLTRGGGSRR